MTKHLIKVPLTPAEAREHHITALCTSVRMPIARVLPALGFRDPLLRGGQWRLTDVDTCPTCGVGADPDRPDDLPLLVGSSAVVCVCGCELGPRELLEIYADTDEKLDAALSQISVGRQSLARFYFFDLQTSSPGEGETPKYRRAVGSDVLEVLRRLEVTGESTVRAVVIDAADLVVAQSTIRSASEIPWHPKLPLNYKGELERVDWHNAPLSRNERELQRRRRAYNLAG